MGRAMEDSDTFRHRRSSRYSRLAQRATVVCAVIALSFPTVSMAVSDPDGESSDGAKKDSSKMLTKQVGERTRGIESTGG